MDSPKRKKHRPRLEFWSSVEYGGFLGGLIEELKASGIEARQRFLIRETSYRKNRGVIKRVWLRIQQYVLYPTYMAACLSGPNKADRIVVCTNTFYAPLLATFLHRRVTHLVYDLFPEALVHAGKLSPRSLGARFLGAITAATMSRAEANVFLGERLKVYAESRYRITRPSVVIPVGADATPFSQPPLQVDRDPLILYCGNFGYMHEDETLYEAWKASVGDTDESIRSIRWRFHCTGPRVDSLRHTVHAINPNSLLSIEIGSGLSRKAWLKAMTEAEVALVTTRPGSESVVMPSKTYSALCAGQAILAIAPAGSDLADLIKTHHCGWWVEPGNVGRLLDVLREIAKDPDKLLDRRANAYRCGHEHYSQSVLARDWIRLLH